MTQHPIATSASGFTALVFGRGELTSRHRRERAVVKDRGILNVCVSARSITASSITTKSSETRSPGVELSTTRAQHVSIRCLRSRAGVTDRQRACARAYKPCVSYWDTSSVQRRAAVLDLAATLHSAWHPIAVQRDWARLVLSNAAGRSQHKGRALGHSAPYMACSPRASPLNIFSAPDPRACGELSRHPDQGSGLRLRVYTARCNLGMLLVGVTSSVSFHSCQASVTVTHIQPGTASAQRMTRQGSAAALSRTLTRLHTTPPLVELARLRSRACFTKKRCPDSVSYRWKLLQLEEPCEDVPVTRPASVLVSIHSAIASPALLCMAGFGWQRRASTTEAGKRRGEGGERGGCWISRHHLAAIDDRVRRCLLELRFG